MAISKYYSRQGLWTLFLMCALPLHIWTFILAFRDFDWVAARTNSWDAVGVIAYGLLFAFIESAIVFFVVVLLGFFVSNKWGEKRRVGLMSALIIILSLWSIFNQYYFLNELDTPAWLVSLAAATGRPLVTLYAVALAASAISILFPVWFILKSDKVLGFVHESIDRLSILMLLYLFFDAAALVVVLIRNL
ncbi:MAG: hypothetical protein HS100_17080 [Anaerolineales bacterium]|nr:hypothetical protein [Anaerolineales bacterium]